MRLSFAAWRRGGVRRLVSGWLLSTLIAPLAGCLNNPNAVTGASAPGLAGSGRAYVVLDSYESLDGLAAMVSARARQGVQFVNAAAPFNPFYARTPASMKLGTLPPNAGGISAIVPGTYRLVSMEVAGHPCFFGMADSPVEFSVAPGDVVYLGALEYHYGSTHNALNVFAPPSYEVSFGVVDELAAHLDEVTKKLALLPGHPAIRTRLMTIRKPDVAVTGASHWGASRVAPDQPPPPPQPPRDLPPAPSSSDDNQI